MMIDWTINIGNILAIIGFVGGAAIVVLTMRGDIKLLAQRMEMVEVDLSKIDANLSQIAKVIVELARQEERISAQDRRMNDLANRQLALEHERQSS